MQIPKRPVIKDLQGNVITLPDLPSPDTVRWTANRKATVVRAVRGGLVPLQEMLDRYHMTEKEFLIWEHGLQDDGATGLKVTHFQKRRLARKAPSAG
jgi:hypothetical protein